MSAHEPTQDEKVLLSHPRSDAETHAINRQVWDRMAAAGEPLCTPATLKELANPLGTVDPLGWLGPTLRGWRVLCLAAGGGRHSALYSAAGAQVTVVDLSPAMLEIDRQMARQHGFDIQLIEGSMEQLPMLTTASFDLVIHPVSTCYVPKVGPVFAEVARLVAAGGMYVSQHKQPISLQATTEAEHHSRYRVEHTYYRDQAVPHPPHRNSTTARLRESGAREYLHRWEEIVGGICRSGFVIEDLVEPLHAKGDAAVGTFEHRATYIAPYVRIKARRIGVRQGLWVPGNR